MMRNLFSLFALLSLLLCVATVVLWVRSYWAFESVRYEISHYTRDWDWKYMTFNYCGGELYWTAGHHFSNNISRPESSLMAPEGSHFVFESEPPIPQMWLPGDDGKIVDWQGFYVHHDKTRAVDWYENTLCLGIPAWFAVLITIVLPLMAARMMRLRRHNEHARCLECRYDLL